ncbi:MULTISPECIES: hypothetical protein [unclassified Pseudonocardia]|nr:MULTISPECIES: hypothetical protein [unclassified Pseudonocardia]
MRISCARPRDDLDTGCHGKQTGRFSGLVDTGGDDGAGERIGGQVQL